MKRSLMLITWMLAPFGIFQSAARSSAGVDTIVVARDGSGNFTSIERAVESCKSFPYQRIVIYIKNGIYREKVRIPEWNTRISLIGQNKDSTILTYGDYFGKIGKGPNSTFYTATLLVEGNDFHAENLTIENSAGPVGQAIALAVGADRCEFTNCRLLGNQDTLYCTGEGARQYFRNCLITGTTDFIFGEATALFDSCELIIKSDSYFTAASTPEHMRYGFVFRRCSLSAPPGVQKALLGRPWRKYAKTVYLRCRMSDCIAPSGWGDWNDPANHKTVLYAEYLCTGPGADRASRAPWSRELTTSELKNYTREKIFAGIPAWNPTE